MHPTHPAAQQKQPRAEQGEGPPPREPSPGTGRSCRQAQESAGSDTTLPAVQRGHGWACSQPGPESRVGQAAVTNIKVWTLRELQIQNPLQLTGWSCIKATEEGEGLN